MSLRIGPYLIAGRAFVAPMAGVTDRPYRRLCRRLGARYAVSEMTTANLRLQDSVKTVQRRDHRGEAEPRAVQIAGADPIAMAAVARLNAERGAQIIDINMGCPARKVCNVMAGSALMGDESLALRIIDAVVAAVAPMNVPVTLKMRTGPTQMHRNAVRLAQAAEQSGIAMIVVHGRSRACRFAGQAEYETIAAVKRAVSIPVVANGDIDSPQRARAILESTGADAVMIGRAAQGRPWIFGQVDRFLDTGELLPDPDVRTLGMLLSEHLQEHYAFYGEYMGTRTARKHVAWYLRGYMLGSGEGSRSIAGEHPELMAAINASDSTAEQLGRIEQVFRSLSRRETSEQTA